ncbi:DmpA family aminopeptidase [Virgibacillus sp. W0430]|uniref:DmpA family aminopeptidase n=1 Tax=Virgibacillus sp. W0430 TaxID=3391580 RepID=UPI003F471938
MVLQKGKANCITDVKEVKVGHVTLYEKLTEKDTICTGVTAILPHSGNLYKEKVRAACEVINGFGKSAGLVEIEELGLIESPIMLTNTMSVGPVMQGALTYMLEQNEDIGNSSPSINIVVGECNDGFLNSMRMQSVKPNDAVQAIENACQEPTQEGAVGAGKGMICYGYKGGIGTASREVIVETKAYTIGCLVLSNFGKREEALFANWEKAPIKTPEGSIMMIIATDAPFYDRQLRRLAKRCAAGLARTGSHMDHGSGDIAIAFSTANKYKHNTGEPTEKVTFFRDDHKSMNQFFLAVTEATEEAIINSLKQAETTIGKGGFTVEKAPL